MPALSSPLSAWFLLSRLAEMGILMPLALLVAWRLLRAPHSQLLALRWLLALTGAAALTTATKVAFMGWGVGSAALNFTGVSGHTMAATAVYPVLLMVLMPKAWPVGPALGLGCLLALLVGVSRVELGAHSWSEVVSGWALGAAVVWAALRTPLTPQRPRFGALWWLAGAAWLLAGVLEAPVTPTHSWVTRLALALSGQNAPYTRHHLLNGHARQPV